MDRVTIRLGQSKRTLQEFQAGNVAPRPDLRRIRNEIAALDAFLMAHPTEAERISRLIHEWQEYMVRMKLKG